MARTRTTKEGGESNPKVALVTAIICVLFVVFVFVYDDLKNIPFVQGLTGIIVALAIAVILFSAVPGSKATVKLPISLAGAAAFYFFLLPRIEPFIFSLHSFTGYVAYESSNRSEQGFDPVEGAEVEVKGTGLKAKTDATGKFTISDVPSQITISELLISRSGKVHQIKVKEYPDRVYRIPEEPKLIESVNYTIGSNEWGEDKNNGCPPVDKNKYSSVKHFLLHKTVHREGSFSDLILSVWCQQGAEIISARKLEPQDGYKVKKDDVDYSQAQKWSLPMSGDEITIRLSVCLGAAKGEKPLSQSSLQASYRFQKVE